MLTHSHTRLGEGGWGEKLLLASGAVAFYIASAHNDATSWYGVQVSKTVQRAEALSGWSNLGTGT